MKKWSSTVGSLILILIVSGCADGTNPPPKTNDDPKTSVGTEIEPVKSLNLKAFENDASVERKSIDKVKKEDADKFYKNFFWKGRPISTDDDVERYPNMDAALALVMFDTKVVLGDGSDKENESGAAEFLQRALVDKGYLEKHPEIKEFKFDGDIGPSTLTLLKEAKTAEEHMELAQEVLNKREIQHCTYNQGSLLEGYLNRVIDLRGILGNWNYYKNNLQTFRMGDHFKIESDTVTYCENKTHNNI